MRTSTGSRAAAPAFSTLVHALRWRAEHQPERLAYRFLLDGDGLDASLTYGELQRRTNAIAGLLRSHRTTGERVLIIVSPGLDFIAAWFGCLSAGAIAIAIHPPHPSRPEQFANRLTSIVRDATPVVALTTQTMLDGFPAELRAPVATSSLEWHAIDGDLATAPGWDGTDVRPQDLAFIQYTSGATLTPRGVMVSHANLQANLEVIRASFNAAADTSSVSWLPPYHDLGLIGGILAPLHIGAPATLMTPAAFIQRPARWLRAISRFGARTSGSPNFGYDHCVRRIRPEQLDGIDLSGWAVAYTGAEPISAATLREFADAFTPYGFQPAAFKACYGLAESTLLVSSTPSPGPPAIRRFDAHELGQDRVALAEEGMVAVRDVPSCGPPAQQVLIVDPDSMVACPEGTVGEIWMAGPSIARGYWNSPAATDETFRAALVPLETGPWLRSGDLGFLLEGELYVTGRLKELIIIDGQNHYPQDIEQTVARSHPAIGPADCAAFSVMLGEREGLVVMAALVGRSRASTDEVCRAIRAAVSRHHEVRVDDIVLLASGHIPKTTSGKIRRTACRNQYLADILQPRATP